MADKLFQGEIKAKIIELRFAVSGKVEKVLKGYGQEIKKGELLANLDKKMSQADLDRQLADYEKVRAEFEIFNLQKGEPQDDVSKFLKAQKQASLNVSIKDVELAKMKLDQLDLFSPVDGMIIGESNLVPGIYITPSSNPIEIIDYSSYYFEFPINVDDLTFFSSQKQGELKIKEIGKTYSIVFRSVVGGKKELVAIADITEKNGLFLGLKAEAVFA